MTLFDLIRLPNMHDMFNLFNIKCLIYLNFCISYNFCILLHKQVIFIPHIFVEITQLRHKVEEMNDKNKQKNTAVHNEVREEYSKLVENFFLASSQLREKFDVFRFHFFFIFSIITILMMGVSHSLISKIAFN